MLKLTDDEILSIIPVPNGVILTVVSEITEDKKMAVEYKMVSVDGSDIQRVSKDVYMLAKFGVNHRNLEMQVKNHLTCICALLKGGNTLIIEEDGAAKILNENGVSEWLGKIKYKDEPPCSAVFDGENVWACFMKNNALIRYDAVSMREQLRIGGKEGTGNFSGPAAIFPQGEDIYVSAKTGKQVWKINTKTYAAEEYLSFDNPVRAFVKLEKREFALFNDGLYEV